MNFIYFGISYSSLSRATKLYIINFATTAKDIAQIIGELGAMILSSSTPWKNLSNQILQRAQLDIISLVLKSPIEKTRGYYLVG
ncbi:hypothetical protein RUND412_010265, partial [Rhizina undulata]